MADQEVKTCRRCGDQIERPGYGNYCGIQCQTLANRASREMVEWENRFYGSGPTLREQVARDLRNALLSGTFVNGLPFDGD